MLVPNESLCDEHIALKFIFGRMKVKITRTSEIRVEKETWKNLRETTITD
jgi:hypothetical protein